MNFSSLSQLLLLLSIIVYVVPYFRIVRDFLPSSSSAASEKLNDVSYSFSVIARMLGKRKLLSISSNGCIIHLGVTVFHDSVAISYSNDNDFN
uniref:Uncharacterized protein n=1 Tax=Glossina palpalis gambiensis TaxID=67801 RepID=A0A1B0BDD7_9MUSC